MRIFLHLFIAFLIMILSALRFGHVQEGDNSALSGLQMQPITLSADQQKIMRQINKALSAVETAQGHFIQINSDNTLYSGIFRIRRPGRIRFDYDQPDDLLIISDGATVAIEDKSLDIIDRVPLKLTPLSIALKRSVDLIKDTDILAVEEIGDFYILSLADKTGEAEGKINLFFDVDKLSLEQWEVIDPTGRMTQIRMLDVKTGMRFDPAIFRLEDEDDTDERR